MAVITRVTINPGHCPGIDPGAVGPQGTREADVALAIGERCAGYLEAAGYQVLLVQNDSLEEICRESDESGADCFVSIHCNAAVPEAHGFEVWTCSPPSRGAARLAERIRSQLAGAFPSLADRGVKASNFYVLLHTDCPAALVETAFISNPAEEILLADPAVQDEYARAIARGISDYCEAVARGD